MPKDYHKGYRLQCYIPDELADALNKYAKIYNMSKTDIVNDALYAYIGTSARESIERYKQPNG